MGHWTCPSGSFSGKASASRPSHRLDLLRSRQPTAARFTQSPDLRRCVSLGQNGERVPGADIRSMIELKPTRCQCQRRELDCLRVSLMSEAIGGRRTDSATRVIDAPPEAIYRAFLDPEAWVKWLPPEGMTGRIYKFEPRPGGNYRMALTHRKVDRATPGKTSEGTDIVMGPFP